MGGPVIVSIIIVEKLGTILQRSCCVLSNIIVIWRVKTDGVLAAFLLDESGSGSRLGARFFSFGLFLPFKNVDPIGVFV